MLDDLLDRFRRRDRLALARLLSLLARGQHVGAILARTERDRPARVVAITGSGGVGKSTLIGKLIEHLRRQNQTVAVLACDPQSPLSGGALLGDRFRMPSQPDEGVFIRSLAAVSGHGVLAEHLDGMIQLLEAFGFDVILLETVGAGQGDTAVRDLADVVVLLLQPEAGDDLQWEKAGLLEVADVVALHKADLPGAEIAEAQIRAALGLSANPAAPVVRVSARTGQGIKTLWQTIAACPLRRAMQPSEATGLLRAAQDALADWFAASRDGPELRDLAMRWHRGQLDRDEAVRLLLHLLEPKQAPSPSP